LGDDRISEGRDLDHREHNRAYGQRGQQELDRVDHAQDRDPDVEHRDRFEQVGAIDAESAAVVRRDKDADESGDEE